MTFLSASVILDLRKAILGIAGRVFTFWDSGVLIPYSPQFGTKSYKAIPFFFNKLYSYICNDTMEYDLELI